MEILELYKQQQELLDKIYPASMRNIFEAQKAIAEQLKILSWFDAFKPVESMAEYTCYVKGFQAIESFQKTLPALKAFDLYKSPAAVDFDFTDLIREEDEGGQVTIEEASNLKHIISDIYKDHAKLLLIDPRKFEELVAELLASQGFEVELTKRTRDGGFVIRAIRKIENFFPLKFLVECKRFVKDKVDVEIVRAFKNVIDEQNANRGIIVTTSYFTANAIQKQAQYPYLLEYKDKDSVLDWIKGYYIERIAAK